MSDDAREDIRRLLKEFGVRADGAIVTHLAQTPGPQPLRLRLRLTLEDLTEYGAVSPAHHLELVVEGTIRR